MRCSDSANGRSTAEILSHPEVRKARPYWRFDSAGDDRVTEICEALDGTIRPADDPFWHTHTPPLHFNAVVGDTEILTSEGLVPAREMRPWMQVMSHAREWRTVTAVLHKWGYRGRRVLRLQLATGRVLRVTKEHPVLVDAPGAGLLWRQAGHLKVGDQLLERGHQLLRPEGTRVVDAKDAPVFGDEPSIPGFVMDPARRGRVAFPIHLYRHLLWYESQIHDVGADRVLGHDPPAEDREQVALCWSERVAIRLRPAGSALAPRIEEQIGVGARHPGALPMQPFGGLGSHAPRPMASAGALGDHRRISSGDPHLVALGSNGDAVANAPTRQHAVAHAVLALQRPDAALAFPVSVVDQRLESLPVGAIEWHAVPIVSIVAELYQGELVDLSVDADETYVAGGVVVHNCRSILVPLSEEEAEEEGVDTKGPDVEADEGFGRQPSGDEPGSGWEPDAKDYPEPIAEVLEAKLVEPDHGPAFPRLEPEPAPEDLPRMERPRWAAITGGNPKVFFDLNRQQLDRVAGGIVQTTNGIGEGVKDHVVDPSLVALKALGAYDRGHVFIRPDVATRIRDAVARGAVLEEDRYAFGAMLHEQFHGASNPAYLYERHGLALEEASTELLAQHYEAKYIKALGLKDRGPKEGPLFKEGPDGPAATRQVGYPKFVESFARLVAYVDDVQAGGADFDRHVAGRALQVKKAKGMPGQDERVGLLVRPVLDRRGIKPTQPGYEAIRGNLSDLFADFMERKGHVKDGRIADLDAWVSHIVGGGNYR